MRCIITIISIALCVQSAVGHEKRDDNSAKIISNLNRIETLYIKYLNQQEKQEAVQLLNETRKLAVDIPSYAGENEKWGSQNILNEENFKSMLDGIKGENSDASKTNMVMTIGKNGKITCSQLEKIIMLYTFDDKREELIRKIIDNVVDPVNMESVLKHIDNSIIREQLEKWVQNR